MSAQKEENPVDNHENVAQKVNTRLGYLYGTMAILLCSLLSLLGIPLVLCDRNSVGMQILLQFLIGLAVASMACDAVLHLWPMAVEVHAPHGSPGSSHGGRGSLNHEDIHHSFWSKEGHIGGHVEHLHLFEEEESAAGHLEGADASGSGSAGHHGGHHDKTYLWRSVAVIGALYLFFIFETLMHQSIDHRHTHSLASEEVDARRRDRRSHNHHHHHSHNHHQHNNHQCHSPPSRLANQNTPHDHSCSSTSHDNTPTCLSSSATNGKPSRAHRHHHKHDSATNERNQNYKVPTLTINGNNASNGNLLQRNNNLSSSHSSVESTVDSSALVPQDSTNKRGSERVDEEENDGCAVDLAIDGEAPCCSGSVDFSATVLGVNQSVDQCSECFRDNGGQGDDVTCTVGAKNQHLGLGKTSNIILTSCKDRERKSSICDSVLMQNDPVGDHAAVPPENMQGCKVVPKQPEMVAHVHPHSMCGGAAEGQHKFGIVPGDTRCCQMLLDPTEHKVLVCPPGTQLTENIITAGGAGGTSKGTSNLEVKKSKTKFARDSEYRASLRHLQRMGVETKTRFGIPEDKFALVMMIMFGDMFHNLSDGLAVGAAFGAGSASGISTSIAVLFHELPHELGDFAILYDSGISVGRILMLNAISSLAAFAGLFIGVALSETDGSYEWIFAVTAGMFLYVAFIDMLPQMMHVNTNSPWIVYGVQNLGLLTGFTIMLLLALNEE